MIYIPTSLDQPVGAAFGVQAGFAELSSAITQGGFAKVRKAAAASPTFASSRRRPQIHRHDHPETQLAGHHFRVGLGRFL